MKRCAPALLLAGFCVAQSLNAATFTASLERETITLGESVTLSLTFSGGTPQSVPSPGAIPNLRISYVGPSSEFSMINGQVSSKVTHNFTVTPQQAGDFNIPAFSAQVGAETLTTQPLKLKVLSPGSPSAEAVNSGQQLAFIKWVLPKQEIFLGESIVAEMDLYLNQTIQNVDHFQLTSIPADGFTIGEKKVQGNNRQVQIGNTVYTVVPWSMALRPVKTGQLTLGPATASIVVEIPTSRRRVRDPFNDPFGFFGGGNEQRQLSLASETNIIHVLPLPTQNVPPNFNGAVGNYTLVATAGPTNLSAGDPITIKAQLSGHGAIDSVTLPEQTWRDFNAYPPTSKVDVTDNLGLQGTKSFEQVVVPQSADIKELPSISFSFFDPDQKQYRTLTQPAMPLLVRPGGAAPPPTFASTPRPPVENPPPAQDIVNIKQRPGALSQISPPLIQQPWFMALQAVPMLAWVTALAWRKRTDNFANNPRLRRRRQVATLIRDGVLELRRFAQENNSDEFFNTLVKLLQEQLGAELDLPASSITDAVVEEHLRPRGVPESVLASVRELFQLCNLARYAPIKTSQELAAIIPKLEAALQSLQKLNG